VRIVTIKPTRGNNSAKWNSAFANPPPPATGGAASGSGNIISGAAPIARAFAAVSLFRR